MSAPEIRKFINLCEGHAPEADCKKCSAGRKYYQDNLTEDEFQAFDEFMIGNGGQVVDLGGHFQLVMIKGEAGQYIKNGVLKIPGLNTGGVEIWIGGDHDDDDDEDDEDWDGPDWDDKDDEDDDEDDETWKTKKPKSPKKPKGPTGSVQEYGSTDVIYDVGVSEKIAASIKGAVQYARKFYATLGMNWLTNCTIYVDCLCRTRGKDVVGLYHPDIDKITLTDWDYDGIHNTLVHEFGHRFHYQCRATNEFDRAIESAYNGYIQSGTKWPSEYSKTDHYEWLAECFNAWAAGNFVGQYKYSKWMTDLIMAHSH